MQTPNSIDSVESVVQRYFDLMYDCDVSRFDDVFHPTAQLHGVVNGTLNVWPASTYRDILSTRTPPSQVHAPRAEQVLLSDAVSDDQVMVKVKVRIHDREFIDHLCMLRIEGNWRITSKTFHLASEGASV
jgi:hypothetical protein